MNSSFNPIGRKCVVYSEQLGSEQKVIIHEGVSVGFLDDYVGIEGSIRGDQHKITIEWFPRDWIISGRIEFYYQNLSHSVATEAFANKHNEIEEVNRPSRSSNYQNKPFESNAINPKAISELPEPTFGSIVRYVVKDGYLDRMLKEIVNEPAEEAVSQHTITSNTNEIINVTLVPELEGMVSKEDTGISWLDTVEDMLVKFPNDSRTDSCSGSVIQYSFNAENAQKYNNDSWVMSVIRMKAKNGCERELTDYLTSSKTLIEERILRCIIQIESREFIIINQDSIEKRIEDDGKLLKFLDSIEHLLEFFGESRTDPRSGIVASWYNC